MSILDTMLTGKVTSDIVLTPDNVAKDMVDLLSNEVWTSESTFLDIATKGGIFLKLIYDKLMNSTDLINKFPDEASRRNHILQNQIYGLSVNDFCAALSQRRLYGKMDNNSNIKCINGYYDIIRDDRRFKLTIERTFKKMKFDVVIGNPPYNRGMDLAFVNKGFDLCTKYCVMITPAKWQTSEADQRVSSTISYGEFRKKLVKHMSEVVFYPDAGDVFDIGLKGGISYFVMDKDEHEKCTVTNKMKNQPIFNSIEVRDIRGAETLLNIGNEINMELKNYRKFIFNSVNTNLKYLVVNSNKVIGAKGNCFLIDGTATVLSKSEIIERGNPINTDVVFASDSECECKSFISWIDTKLVRFMVLINLNKLGPVMTNDYFRFVPAPPSGKFDHIYTDEELYKAFNLPQKYIDVIEAVIKERK